MAKEGTISSIREFEPINSTSLHLDLAKFAIYHYNSKEGTSLRFVRLVHIKEVDEDTGTMFYITTEVTDGTPTKKHYEAKVWIKSKESVKEAKDFKYICDAPAEA